MERMDSMATELASAYVSLYAKLKKGFGKDVESQIGAEVDGSGPGRTVGNAFSSGMRLALAAGTVAMGNMLATLASSAAAEIGNIFGDAMNSADMLRKYEKSMAFAGFDQATIESSKNAMKQYADETVYDLDTITQTTQILGSNGVANFEGVTEALGNLNAVAGGSAESFDATSLALTQIVGAGKLASGDWRQFVSNLPGSAGIIKDTLAQIGAFDPSMETFEEAMSKGEISSDEFLQAIEAIGSSGAAEEAATATDTFEGAIGNLRASIESGLLEGIEAIGMDNITAAINSVTDVVTAASPTIAAMIKLIADHADIAVPVVGAFALALGGLSVADKVAGPIARIGEAVKPLATKAPEAGKGLKGMGDGVGGLGNAAGRSWKNILSMGAAVLMVGGGVALAAVGVRLMADAAVSLADAGWPAVAVLGGIAGALVGVGIAVASAGTSMLVGSVGFLVFAAALALIGVGVLAATAGVSLLAAQLPTIAAYGGAAALALLQVSGSLLAISAASLVAAAAGIAGGAGLLVLGAGSLVAFAGVAVLSAGVALLSAATALLGGAVLIAAGGMSALAAALAMAAPSALIMSAPLMLMAVSLPLLAATALVATAGIGALGLAMAASALGVGTFGFALGGVVGPMESLASSSTTAVTAMGSMQAACDSMQAALAASSSAASAASSAWSAMASTVRASAEGIGAAASSSLSRIPAAATSAMAAGMLAIVAGMASMQAALSSMRLTIPAPRVEALPHFRYSGSFDPQSGAVPQIAVSYYRKGALFERAAVLGEADPEYALPLNGRTLSPLSEGIAARIGGGADPELLSKLDEVASRIENMKIYLDGDALVGGTMSRMDRSMRVRSSLAGRGVV